MCDCAASGVVVSCAPGTLICGCFRLCSFCWCDVASRVVWYGCVSLGVASSLASSSSISEYQSVVCASVRCACVTSCFSELLLVFTVLSASGFVLLGSLCGTIFVSAGLLTLISKVATGSGTLLLGSFTRCSVFCMRCFAVLVLALMLIVTSISSGWRASVFGPFSAGFAGAVSYTHLTLPTNREM